MMAFQTFFGAWLEETYLISTTQVGLVFMISGAAGMPGGPIFGKLADKSSKKTVAVFCTLGLGVLLYWIPFAPALLMVTIASALVNFFASGRFTTTMAIFSEIVSSADRSPLLLGVHFVIQAGIACGAFLASGIVEHYNFLGAAHLAGGITLAAAYFITRIPEKTHNH